MNYFISFSHNKGFGNIELTLKNDITTMEHIKEIKQHIERNTEAKDVVVLFYSKLS